MLKLIDNTGKVLTTVVMVALLITPVTTMFNSFILLHGTEAPSMYYDTL